MSVDRGRVVRRRRGEHLETDILAAAWDELLEHGWAGFNMPRVAARAGTGKTSVYSRWPTKAALVAAAAFRHTHFAPNPLNLGEPLEDALVWVLQGAADLMASPFGAAVRAVASEYPSIPEELRRSFNADGPVRVAADVVDRAREVGELGPDPIAPHIINVGFDVLTTRFLLSHEPLGPAVVRSIVVDLWIPALRAAAPPRRAPSPADAASTGDDGHLPR